MKTYRLAILLSLTTLTLAACGGNTETASSMSSATSAANSAASDASSAASSVMSSATSAMMSDGVNKPIVEVDGAPLEGDFTNVVCLPGDADDGPKLDIESEKGSGQELDLEIKSPEDNPRLGDLDVMVDQTHLETDDHQEMGATVSREGNTWMVETDAFRHEGPHDDTAQGTVVKVKVNVTCPA